VTDSIPLATGNAADKTGGWFLAIPDTALILDSIRSRQYLVGREIIMRLHSA